MDLQRLFFGTLLAVLTFVLIIQWDNDYGHLPSTPSNTVARANTDNGDLPTQLNSNGESVTSVAVQIPKDLVEVNTDVLNLKINPKGGDIVYASLLKHKAQLNSDAAFVLMDQTQQLTYIAQSGLIGANGPDASNKGRPNYQVSAKQFNLGAQERLDVDLTFKDNQGVQIIKRYSFAKGSYVVGLSYIVNNQSSQVWHANLFGQIKRDANADPNAGTDLGMQSYLGAIFSTAENNYEKVDFDDMDKSDFKARSKDGYVAFLQHYFTTAWVPAKGSSYNYTSRVHNNNYIVGFVAPELAINPGAQQTIAADFYVGPKDIDQMGALNEDLKLTIDYGWLWWVASPLYFILKWLYQFVGNWGLAIIATTILVKLALYQLNAKAYNSMAKMRKFGPEMQRLKELYGDDRQKMSQEMMSLYKKEKINPLGGCLPMLAQMPIFIALYWVLMESVELRHAEFLYMSDLSIKDPYFILPLLMGASMWFQQSLNPKPTDPMQAKIMQFLPVIFTVFFLWFPAGLTLYWVVNNLLSIAQQYMINKKIEGTPNN